MAKERCSIFHGRETILDKIADYLQRKDDAPFTVYGPSGSGKTSIIAEAARKVSFCTLRKGWIMKFIFKKKCKVTFNEEVV